MTAITKAEIPDTCNSLEKLAAWAIMTLRRTNPTMQVIEIADEAPQRVASSSILEDSTQVQRFLGRVSLPIDSSYESSELPLWESVQDLSNTVIPPAYLN